MELFRIIKKDAAKAMRFFGGRTIASVIIIVMAYLAISLTETILLFIFSGAESLYSGFYSLVDSSPEVIGITLSAAVLYILVIPPLCLGYAKLNFAFAEGRDESMIVLFDMFSSFKKYIGAFIFSISASIRGFFVFSAAMIPGGAAFFAAQNYLPESTRTLQILKIAACCAAISLMIFGVAAAVLFIQRWQLAPYYFISGSKIHKSFSLSSKAAKGLNSKIISFKFSFIGWVLLSFLVLPLLWSVPFYSLSNAIYAKYLMEKYEHSLAETPGDVLPLQNDVIVP